MTFDESVTGVNASDFALATTGTIAGASVGSVVGSGSVYTVSIGTGGGDGTIRLDVIDDNSIRDASLDPLGGPALGDGNFSGGQTYTLDRTAEIRGTQWDDLDRDGLRDPNEPGLAGVTLFLDINGNRLPDAGELTTTSTADDPGTSGGDETGQYAFRDLSPGTYSVVEVAPTGWQQTFPITRTGATGRLTIQQMLKDNTGGVDGLDEAAGVALSPDGNHIYIASYADSALTVFRRDPQTGVATFLQTIKDNTGSVDGLWGAQSVVVSPDGQHVYVASFFDDAVAVFQRDFATGTVTFVERWKDGVSGVDGLDGALSVAISPDGSHVYAAGTHDDAIVLFTRNPTTGQLTFSQKYQDNVGGIDGLDGAFSVVVSPDGAHVYASGAIDDAVVAFSRNPTTGTLTFLEWEMNGLGGVSGLNFVKGITLTPDGKHLYAAGSLDDAIAVFTRNTSTGFLTFVQSTTSTVLNGVVGVAVSPDNAYVYTAAELANATAVYSRNTTTGQLTFIEQHQDGANGVDGLSGAWWTTVSPDGLQVYSVGAYDDALVGFGRNAGTAQSQVHTVTLASGQIASPFNFANGNPAPVVTSINRANPSPTPAASVQFTVTVSEVVSGVDLGDFALGPGAPEGATVSAVVGGGTSYTVTVNTGTGDGTLRLDVVDNDSIVDIGGRPLGGTGASNGNFTSGQTYTVDKTSPAATSIVRTDPNPTDQRFVRFTVNFSEAVTGVDAADFLPNATGTFSGVAVTGVTGSASAYVVTVDAGTGDGTLRLDLIDNDSIVDQVGLALGGAGVGNGNRTGDQSYTILTDTAQIAGTKWNDLNRNGVRDAGEPGLPGWIISLDANDNGRRDPGEAFATTDSQGNYAITGVESGTYTVAEEMQPGWRQTSPATDALQMDWASLSSAGVLGNSDSYSPSLSADGRYVAFASWASNLVSGDLLGFADVFVRDRQTGVTQRISVGLAGVEANGQSSAPHITPDGRYVTFESTATNLVVGDTNAATDVFVHDRQTGVTERVSLASNGTQANGASQSARLTPDGRFVVFHSAATNFVANDTNARTDVFLYDRQLDSIEQITVFTGGIPTNGYSQYPAISADARWIVFYSSASNLVVGDTNAITDIFVFDRQLATFARVSVGFDGSQANASSQTPAISDDGRFVAFESNATNLIPVDTNEKTDVFVFDRTTGLMERVSVAADGLEANGNSTYPVISADGRDVAYLSDATNLVPGDTNTLRDAFIIDRQTYVVRRASVAPSGTQTNGYTAGVAISPNGDQVSFESPASGLMPGDTNTRNDVFVATVPLHGTHRIAVATGQTLSAINFSNRSLVGQIEGSKWNDVDGDRIWDAGEEGLPGWTIYLDTNANRQLDAGEPIRTTDGFGQYSFFDLPAGAYSVGEVIPSGWGQTYPSDMRFDPVVQSSIRDQPLNGLGDSFNSLTWLLSQTSTVEDRVIAEFDTSLLAGTRLSSAFVDFDLFINNSGGDTTRTFNLYLYGADGVANLSDFSTSAVFTGSASRQTSGATYVSFHVNVTAAMQQVLDAGGTMVGLRVDPAGTNIFATGIERIRLTAASPEVDAEHRFMLAPGQVRTGVDFGNRDIVPYVKSIARVQSSPTTASTVDFTVTFSEAVTGVDVADFAVTPVGPIGAAVTNVSGSGAVYLVTISTGTGDGTLRLDVVDNDTVRDDGNNGLEGPGPANGNYTKGPVYVVDRELPVVTQIQRVGASPTNAATVNFTVRFSEPVTGVDVTDFALSTAGLTGVRITQVTGSGSIYTVTAGTGAGQGTLRLDYLTNATVFDTAGRPSVVGFTGGESYDIDHVVPAVTSIVRLDPNPTSAATIRFAVTFSEPVTGVDATDFLVTAVGPVGAAVTNVAGGGTGYTVTVATGSGDGRIRLDGLDNNSILDLVGNATGTGFTAGELYVVDRVFPTVATIVLTDVSPTSATTVRFTVTFSEPVSGVDATDFGLVTVGVSGAAITTVSGTDMSYTVTVNTGSGDGTLRLDLLDNDSIVDGAGRQLGGAGSGTVSGPVYSIFKTPGIYGSKWHDTDSDGVRDAGELGIAGVTIYLDRNQNGVFDAGDSSTITQADDPATADVDETGNYQFVGLVAGVYVVAEVVPAYHAQSFPPVAGGTGGLTFGAKVVDGLSGVDGLAGANALAMSPDGKFVYSAADVDDAVAVFSRHPASGLLSFVQTIKQGSGGLTALDGAFSVAVIPDGTQVLVTSTVSDALIAFNRDQVTGQLTHRQNFRDGVSGADGLDGASAVAISADNKHAYVAANNEHGLSVFQRDSTTGNWSFVQVLKDGVAGVDGLLGARSVAISPDGLHVVVAANLEDKISLFSRDATTGQLTYQGVVQDNLNGVDGLDGATAVAFSPDGANLYVSAQVDHAVAVFQRNIATNQLIFVHRLKDGVSGVDGLLSASSVRVAPDGRHVVATGASDNAVAVFSRNAATGELTYLQRYQENVSGVTGLNGAAAVVVSPDDNHVYVAGKSSNAIASFARDAGVPARAHRVPWTVGQIALQRDFGNYRLPLQVIATEPAPGDILRTVPTTFRVHFNFDVLASSLNAGDLAIDGTPASGFAVVDSDTVDFTLPSLGEGLHTFTIAAGSILQANGPAVLAFQSTVTIDLTAPLVTVTPQVTTDSTPLLTGTVNDATATVRVTLLGLTYTATNPGNGTWSIADNVLSPLVPYGIHSVTAIATDPAGNIGTEATTNELEVVRSLLTVTGPPSVLEGGSYTVSLAHHASIGPMTSWTVDWGDGALQTLPGDPTGASHTYADGAVGYSIRATARNAAGTTYTSDVSVSPDPLFGTGGFVATPIGAFSSNSRLDVVVQPDGKPVVIGEDSSNRWVVTRHLDTGGLDVGFGASGSVVVPFLGQADSFTRPRAIALQSDGKIVVAGNSSQNAWVIARFLANGAPDPSFGSNGQLQVNRGLDSRLYDLAIDGQGRMLVVATEWQGTGSQAVLARVTASGSLDATFGVGGVVLAGAGDNAFDGAEALAILRDGRIVVAGYFNYGSGSWISVTRYLANGSVDTTFGSGGIFYGVFSGTYASARAVAIDEADRVVVAADLDFSTDDDWGIMRLTKNGALDRTFSEDGRVILDLSNTNDRARDVVVQRDGRIVVTGATAVTGSGDDLALARLLTNGSLDSSFAGDGTWVLSPRPSVFESLQAVALAPDDRILAVTGYQGTMELARLDVNPGWIAAVNNVAPTLTVTGAASIAEGLPYTLSLAATDPGFDSIAYWTVDWGDGVTEFLHGSATQAQHVYSRGGYSRSIVVTATDEDGNYMVPGPTVTVNEVARGEVRGVKWHDADNDGVRDANEPGLGGITIYLDSNDNAAWDAGEPSTVTRFDDPLTGSDETGTYVLTNVIQGSYLVGELLSSDRTQTFPGVQASPQERVSVTTAGVQGDNASQAGQISDDGRYVAFRSSASNLVPGDTNGFQDLFVYDRQLDTVSRASVNPDGSELPRETLGWSLSGNGRYVAWEHWRTMTTDQFTVRDLLAGQTIVQSSTSQSDPSLNSSGQFMSYTLQGVAAYDYNVYLRDLIGNSTVLASRTPTGAKGNLNSGQSTVSDDGRYVAFTTHSSDLVPQDTNSRGDVMVFDRTTATATRVSVSSTGEQSDGDSFQPDLSGDGRYVVFTSEASNLVVGDTNDHDDIFLRDRTTGITERISVATGGLQANADSIGAAVSADGRYVLFASSATNLVSGDTNGVADLFLRDRIAGTTERVSRAADRSQTNGASFLYPGQRAISADGRYITFASAGTNLVAGDTNGSNDTFVAPTTLAKRAGTHQVTVLAGQTVANVDFGSRGPLGEIGGQLWRDTDGDGVLDAGEVAQPNRTVFLDLNGNDQLDPAEPSQVTDSSGSYAFRNLRPGSYDVLVVPVAGWQQTSPQPFNGDFTYLAADGNDHVYDPLRKLLYLTANGSVLRYDVVNRSFLSPFTLGSSPVLGADITPDGTSLYAAGGTSALAFQKINLQTGAITAIPYTPAFGESTPWDVAFSSDGFGFLTTQFAGSGSVPLRRIDWRDGTLTTLGTTDQKRNIWRSFDYQTLVFDSFSFAPQIYEASTSSFQTVVAAVFDDPVAISPDRSLMAVAGYQNLVVYDNRLANPVFSAGNYEYNGGVTFDPVRDLLYVGNIATQELVAFDTNTWQPRFRLSGFQHGLQRFQEYSEGQLSVSPDGRLLFVSTGQAVQIVRLTARHRVSLAADAVVTGRNFGERVKTFQTLESTVPPNAILNVPPSQVRVVFNDAVDPSTVQASDLTVGGLAATGASLDGATAVVFAVPPLSDGTKVASMAANAVRSTQGIPLAAWQISFEIDTQSPVVMQLSPADNASSAPPQTNLTLTFSEKIQKGTGQIFLKKSSDNAVVETIPVSDARVSVSDTVATIDPAASLAENTSYYVEIDAGAFRDLAGNSAAGISGPTAWNFTTNASPRVAGIYVRGGGWSSGYLDLLAASGLGTATGGYRLLDGSNQIANAGLITWTGVNQIAVTFTEDVTVANGGFRLLNSNNQDLTLAPTGGFSYDPVTYMAKWTLDTLLARDKFLIALDASKILDSQGAALDGEWTTSSSTYAGSGNGATGGNLYFRFNSLPGDVNLSGTTNLSDVSTIRGTGTAIATSSTFRHDLNGSNVVNISDVTEARLQGIGTLAFLPDPTIPPPPSGTPLLAAARTAVESVASLDVGRLPPLVTQAITAWAAAGLDEATLAALQQVQFRVMDLGPGLYLGMSHPGRIELDDNAAGAGWFVDPSPEEQSEFLALPGGSSWQAGPGSPAADRIDLLTVILHELGHQLGLAHRDHAEGSADVMATRLALGTRHLPLAMGEQHANDSSRHVEGEDPLSAISALLSEAAISTAAHGPVSPWDALADEFFRTVPLSDDRSSRARKATSRSIPFADPSRRLDSPWRDTNDHPLGRMPQQRRDGTREDRVIEEVAFDSKSLDSTELGTEQRPLVNESSWLARLAGWIRRRKRSS